MENSNFNSGWLIIIIIIILLFCLSNCGDTDAKKDNERKLQEAYDDYLDGEDYWDSVESDYQYVDEDCVYWVPDGYSFHSTEDCVALFHSDYIECGTLEEAYELGKDDPCSKCVGDYY